MFKEKNKVFINNGSSVKIAQLYNKETGSNINHAFVLYHRFKWVLINGEPYEIDKIPKFLLVDDQFKDFAKKRGITIETMKDESEIIAEYSKFNIDINHEAIEDCSTSDVEVLPQPNTNIIHGAVVDCSELILSPSVLTERSNEVASN